MHNISVRMNSPHPVMTQCNENGQKYTREQQAAVFPAKQADSCFHKFRAGECDHSSLRCVIIYCLWPRHTDLSPVNQCNVKENDKELSFFLQ